MSQTLTLGVATLTAAALAYALSPLAARLAVVIGAVDQPGERKVHDRPIPRLGGLAVVLSVAGVWTGVSVLTDWTLPTRLVWGVGLGGLPVLLVSLLDDARSVGAWPKLVAHVTGAAVAVAFGVSLNPEVHLFGTPIVLGGLAVPLSILWIVGVTNAFNIIDGLDGLSAGLALISAISMAGMFAVVGEPAMAGAVLMLAGALAGFLPYNLHPARMFLGDSGATAIGFCLAGCALRGGSTLSTGFAALVPLMMLGVPIADTLITMARRTVLRLERRVGGVFVPDRNHIHHRLLALGIDHARAVTILYGVGAAFAAVAFGSLFLSARHAALFVAAVLAAGVIGIRRLGYDEFAIVRRGTMLRVYETPVVRKSMFVVFVDLALVATAAYLAVGLKQDAWSDDATGVTTVDLLATFAPLTALVFWKTGLYRESWRLAGVMDLARVVVATLLVTAMGMAVHALLWQASHPASLFLIYGLVSLVLVTTSRASYVLLRTGHRRASNQGRPALVYGAGGRGVAAVQELFDNPATGFRPIGFVDDDPEKRGRVVSGLPVLGGGRDIRALIRRHAAQAVIVATPSLTSDRLSRVTRVCADAGVELFGLQMRVAPFGAPLPAPSPAPAPGPSPEPLADPTLFPLDELDLGDERGRPDVATVGRTEVCARCGCADLHRSRAHSVIERIRKSRTPRRPYRCPRCGWRGWLTPIDAWTSTDPSGPTPLVIELDLGEPLPVLAERFAGDGMTTHVRRTRRP